VYQEEGSFHILTKIIERSLEIVSNGKKTNSTSRTTRCTCVYDWNEAYCLSRILGYIDNLTTHCSFDQISEAGSGFIQLYLLHHVTISRSNTTQEEYITVT
jgi:hypothetical protein